jgi:hypothetical protein
MKHTKPLILLCLALLAPAAPVSAQSDIPLLLPEEQRAVERETAELNSAITPSLEEAARSTVRVWSGRRRLAYGTVIGNGSQIVTKWSEIARARNPLLVDAGQSERRSVTVATVYEDEDLVVLDVAGEPLVPIKWTLEQPKLGSFLAATRPDGKLAAFGVVSVLERNIRTTDSAYLGIYAEPGYEGPGVRVMKVEDQTGAKTAGIRPGDIILRVGERPITGLLALRNSLSGIAPGSRISLLVDSNGKSAEREILLGNRPDRQEFFGQRLEQMERMGGPISEVRDSFSHVIQTDMRPDPNQIGGPVVDLHGHAIGITMARADRTRSFVMPAAALEDLLKSKGKDPALAQVRRPEEAAPLPARRMIVPRQSRQVDPRRMRRHLEDMQRLMDYMRDEMDGIDDR